MITSELVAGLFLISVITALLALFIEAAYAYIANYGRVNITINDDKGLEVIGGDPLLSTLMGNRIFIPSACGGKGTCGYCKVRVLEGADPLLPTERPYLSPEEIEQQVRISCQIKVKSDLRIEIPSELFDVKEYTVRVERLEDLTPYIKGIRLSIQSPDEGITFVPGQYIQLQIPPSKLSREPEFRAYSISSHAREHQHIDLAITRVTEGIVSTYVHEYLQEGNELIARGPYGDFRLLESDRDILLIATGSGLSPIRSILYQIQDEQIARKTTFFFGARRPENLFFTEELLAFESILEDFTFIPVLSRLKPHDDWDGETGRVTDLIEKYIPDNAEVDVHICGVPAMVQSCVELLTSKGIPPERIVYDKFE
jgi:Na+-transporting NADH:ubiquinone oxidoreductase subunit F